MENEKSNEIRSGRGLQTIEYYKKIILGEDGPAWGELAGNETVTDLLADLMHLAGEEFEECLRMAQVHYEAEINGEE